MGTSWGLTGPQFLAAYGAVAAVLVAAVLVVRWWPVREPSYPVRLTAEEIGFLAAGPARAYLTAVGSLTDDHRLAPDGRRVGVSPDAVGRTPLETAVLKAVRSGQRPRSIPADRRVTTALAALQAPLAARGLVRSAGRNSSARLLVRLLWVAWAVGWVRFVHGLSEGSPVDALFAAQAGGFFVLVLATRLAAPATPGHARRLVKDVRQGAVAAGAVGPEQLYGNRVLVAAGAGVGVAVAGLFALRAMDPSMASAMEVNRLAGGSAGGSSGSAGDSGGGSSCGGSSSCGGGGGGGGCGGGGS